MPRTQSNLSWGDNTSTSSTPIKGYKLFNKDWTSNLYTTRTQYSCPGVFEKELDPYNIIEGIVFSKEAIECFTQYEFNQENIVAEVLVLGDIKELDGKYFTNKIEIVREVSWGELLANLKEEKDGSCLYNLGENNHGRDNIGDNNEGTGNIGKRNYGNYNTGQFNDGDYNYGNNNYGNNNYGDNNKGDNNKGDNNKGDDNKGDDNVGNRNSGTGNIGIDNRGHYNRGYCNEGNNNTGEFNLGHYNKGNCNKGNNNTGNNNTGDDNSGNYNYGKYNEGSFNIGSNNIGDCNLASRTHGCFNTKSKPLNENIKITFFDKKTTMTLEEWKLSSAKNVLDRLKGDIRVWEEGYNMTEEEKKEHPDYIEIGGYVKKLVKSQKWWDSLSQDDKTTIKSIPNFDPAKFYKITGINVAQ